MKRQIRIILSGVLIVAPFAVTLWVIWMVGTKLNDIGLSIIGIKDGAQPPSWYSPDAPWYHPQWWAGIIIIIVVIYAIGLLTHLLIFRWIMERLERLFERLPGVKTIYVSVRDLMKLFGQDSRAMGRVVEYTPPGQEISFLGIMTSDKPVCTSSACGEKVVVYFPFAYMIGGPIALVNPRHLKPLDMPVEVALKLAATAHVGAMRTDTLVTTATAET